MYKLGLLGYGKMGSSIINGIVNTGYLNKDDITIYSLNKDSIVNDGYNASLDEIDLYSNCDILILAIKPQQFNEVMEKLKDVEKKPRIVVSIAAGITLDYLKNRLGDLKIVRIMPNLGASIKRSVSTMSVTKNMSINEINEIKGMFDLIGTTEIVEEEMINILLPINGSYPAYIWYFIRSFLKAMQKNGASYEQSINLISEATIGSIELLKNSELDIDTLINNVCSYKGTTIEGVNVFDNYNLDSIIEECCNKCSNRAKELESK